VGFVAEIRHDEHQLVSGRKLKRQASLYGYFAGILLQEDAYNTFIDEETNTAFFVVCDGHSVDLTGGIISRFVVEHLFENIKSRDNFLDNVYQAILDGFSVTSEQLRETLSENVYFAGCTCVAVLIRDCFLYVANLGDSKAVRFSCISEEEVFGIPLTEDQSIYAEEERILNVGGQILQDTIPLKVLLKI
jgi:serine/threonine protein phosphatase PrpC